VTTLPTTPKLRRENLIESDQVSPRHEQLEVHYTVPKRLKDTSVKEPKTTSFEESLSELKLLLHNKETGKNSSLQQSPTCCEDGELKSYNRCNFKSRPSNFITLIFNFF
jgi:hypothetical protein